MVEANYNSRVSSLSLSLFSSSSLLVYVSILSLKSFVRQRHTPQFLLLDLSSRTAPPFAPVQAKRWERPGMTPQQSPQPYETLTRPQLTGGGLPPPRTVALGVAMQAARPPTPRLELLVTSNIKRIQASYDAGIAPSHPPRHNWHTPLPSGHPGHSIREEAPSSYAALARDGMMISARCDD